ncbi:16S rRNA (cytidine(1402)-2'-O)-methyltransferase [Alkalilimnicola ehrlichii MLHE-1]|uniref:Ribosomal RNA small subunit methyltransferase I n=1 Tax=Alkalilimnicola ehrlichii (strain ATCC BAA-1101 / DSM 17681 / MLHE-1) TaxID=187272 RepID=Q0A6J2_ALKEH|nr:16S rRNA (cytidine(1402)-2'-O)-methyltransferase [Alkalilimnicola ehrlichii]ABI57545.1 Protein of unknown function UPF0011 [Alkalilimnicola ehrlichii MLHE-1]
MSNLQGTLYVVATPIGNRGDISERARRVLAGVAVVAAEDTRRSGQLLSHYGISARLVSLHEHNEDRQVPRLLARLQAGEDIALISDAGTPLVSDPGYRLVSACAWAGVRTSPVPGPSAVMAALSVAGLPTDRFCFEGFLPARPGPRRKALAALAAEPRTLVLLESSHRILDSLRTVAEVFGPERPAVVARELTKTWETVLRGPVGALVQRLEADPDQRRGEFVLLLAGAPATASDDETLLHTLRPLLAELPVKRAARVAAQITGAPRNRLYQLALREKGVEG